jgi:hypothetical protein
MHMEGNRYPGHAGNNPTIPAIGADGPASNGFASDPADHPVWNWETAWIDIGGEG